MIDALPDDRFGPVVFAGAASHFPLTEDREVASRFLYDLGPADLPPGSNLAEVFRVGRCVLRPDLYDDLGCAKISWRGHGGDPLNGESLDPSGSSGAGGRAARAEGRARQGDRDRHGRRSDPDAEKRCARSRPRRELGIAVIVIGVGTQAGGLVYDLDPITGQRTSPSTPCGRRHGDLEARRRGHARRLAAARGDETRIATAPETGEVDPMPIVEKLNAVNRGLATKKLDEQRDIYQPFVLPAIMLLVIEAAIGTRRHRKYPEERRRSDSSL